ncbi:MAG: IS200/IS605 family element transposase accessory protein TnpB [Candidatus Heimdallarchaeota archaeon]|nr:IS200/IS605 family element transposase accessory protein TnpB [Candidatus Heimdallarchaeota archaeon]
MRVKRTERIKVRPSFTLMQLARQSKNLYNYGNYIIKQQLNKNSYMTSEYELVNMVRYHPCYTEFIAHSAQQTIKFLVKNWKAYFKAKKEYAKQPAKFLSEPKAPKYKDKQGFHTIYFTANQIRLKEEGWVYFPNRVGVKIKTRLNQGTKVNHVRLLPRGTCFILEIIYEQELEIRKPSSLPPKRILAIDLGVNNLVTCVSNVLPPFLIRGRKLKAINQWYNKERSHLQSVYDLQGLKDYGQRMKKIIDKRYYQVENYLHQASRIVIDQCLNHHIDTIVVGYNKKWKHRSKIGKRNNQNFVAIPFLNLIRKLQYKVEEVGITIILTDESYTSKCSFLDDEPLRKHSNYLGRRKTRGQFKSNNGILLNADCNAAGNIGRKVFPLVFTSGTVDAVSHPYCWTV